MAAWLIENVIWLVSGVVVLIVGIKMAVVRLFQRLSAADAAAADKDSGQG